MEERGVEVDTFQPLPPCPKAHAPVGSLFPKSKEAPGRQQLADGRNAHRD